LGLQLFGEDYPEFFEGGGDAVFSDKNTLWAGWGGPRTDKKVFKKKILRNKNISLLGI